eukprot:3166670-Prymnesium_polylepis.2
MIVFTRGCALRIRSQSATARKSETQDFNRLRTAIERARGPSARAYGHPCGVLGSTCERRRISDTKKSHSAAAHCSPQTWGTSTPCRTCPSRGSVGQSSLSCGESRPRRLHAGSCDAGALSCARPVAGTMPSSRDEVDRR